MSDNQQAKQFLAEREELSLDRQRFQQAVPFVVFIWGFLLIADIVFELFISPGLFVRLVTVRLSFLAILLFMVYHARKSQAFSRKKLQHHYLFLMMVLGCANGLYAGVGNLDVMLWTWSGAFGLVTYVSALMARPWREVLANNLVSLSLTVGISLGITGFREEMRPVFHHQPSVMLLVLRGCLALSHAMMSTVVGHVLFKVRKQLFESRSVGRYRLKKKLGEGGMGEVWQAYHETLQQDVAVKILRSDGGMLAQERFVREVKATTELRHPNTVRIFDYGVTDDGLSYYAMELIQGQNLQQLVAQNGPLDPRRALFIALQACRALAEAHRKEIVHRDIKPANLMVWSVTGESEFVKLLDFGVAKQERSSDLSLTESGLVAGTPAYLAPEVVVGQRATKSSDVYSFGAVLYYLLTGSPPFTENNVAAVMRAQVMKQPESPSSRSGRELPKEVEQLVLRCLAKEPSHRYFDATDLTHHLENTLEHLTDSPYDQTPIEHKVPTERHSEHQTKSAHDTIVAVAALEASPSMTMRSLSYASEGYIVD